MIKKPEGSVSPPIFGEVKDNEVVFHRTVVVIRPSRVRGTAVSGYLGDERGLFTVSVIGGMPEVTGLFREVALKVN